MMKKTHLPPTSGSFSAILLLAVFLGSVSAFAQSPPATKTRIAIAGDSTVQTYTDDRGICGWGQILTEWASPDTEVFNEARSGTSSKSFRDLGVWKKVLAHQPQIVFIQFGHNDRSKDPERGTQPELDYSANILAFINETKLAGATPVLVTSPTPRTFRAATGTLSTDVKPYADAMRAVGEREKVLVVDLFSRSFDYFSKLGPEASKQMNPREKDNIHFNRKGAELLAGMIMAELRTKAPDLAAHFSAAPPTQ